MQMFDTLTPLKSGLLNSIRPQLYFPLSAQKNLMQLLWFMRFIRVDRAFPVWGLGFLLQHRHSAAYFRFTTL